MAAVLHGYLPALRIADLARGLSDVGHESSSLLKRGLVRARGMLPRAGSMLLGAGTAILVVGLLLVTFAVAERAARMWLKLDGFRQTLSDLP